MRQLLDAEQINAFCRDQAVWRYEDSSLVRVITLPTFLDGIALVGAVAQVAEELDHHPDIDIRWRTVTFRLSTHSAGGVTELDLNLARRIDALACG
jgi:4a-hydroxytetrahydrobiopterin dehydratase